MDSLYVNTRMDFNAEHASINLTIDPTAVNINLHAGVFHRYASATLTLLGVGDDLSSPFLSPVTTSGCR